jgi:hypothetical protein
MIYRFLLLSDEVDDFKREIQISPQATFLDFHKAILKATGFDNQQIYSFFICNDDWNKRIEITLFEMDTSSEEDSYVMEDVTLEEFLEEEHQKLLYVFDQLSERLFFIELREIITGKDISAPKCTKSVGEPPVQLVNFDEMTKDIKLDLDENFYGDEDFDDEELDDFDKGSFDDPIDDFK